MKEPKEKTTPSFVYTATAADAKHSVGLTADGRLYTWGPTNSLGQLGRRGKASEPRYLSSFADRNVVRAYVGGFKDSGHTAVLDASGNLYVTGCDRWQQLGLGSPQGGAAGYTWGKVFQTSFQRNDFVLDFLRQHDSSAGIRDVALGGDHTVVLSSNRRDVFTFGKGAEGQLGLKEKRFVSAPEKSRILSGQGISAVCAFANCSLTLDAKGQVMEKAGKCRVQQFAQELAACRKRATDFGLFDAERRDTKAGRTV